MEKTNTDKIHVGIVGAGISGLRCADILLAHGFQVTILEARDRIGGRICQSEELGYTVDIGPNWIHTWDSGEVHPIYHLAQQTGTPLHRWNSKQLLFDSEGRRLPDELTDRLSTLLWEVIEEAFEYSAKAAGRVGGGDGATEGRGDGKPPKRWPSTIPADQSLYDFVKKRAAELLPDEGERRLLVQMSEMWGAYVGEPVWTQSLRFAWMEECCGGGESFTFGVYLDVRMLTSIKEEMFVESNYSAILQRIAAPALAGATIKLNTMVTGITTSTRASQENSGAAREQRAVSVSTADGTSTVFDELVVTAPLGWLKRNHERVFSPPLPPRLSSAIANLGLSILEKVFITFPSAFWVSAAASASAAAGQGQDDDDDDPFPSYTNWLSPAYADDTNPHLWPQEIWNLAAFAAPNRHPTMLFYLYGDCSRHVAGIVADTTPAAAGPQRRRYELLDAFFRPYYSRLPGFDPSSADCAPSAILATAWQRDELSGGASYCNFPAGIEAADEDVLAIREGCGEGRALWFCGEHAAPFEECGTVAGAYLSGEAVGRRIVGVRGLEKMEGGEEEEEEGRAGVMA